MHAGLTCVNNDAPNNGLDHGGRMMAARPDK